MARRKIQKPTNHRKWNKRLKIYHNKGNEHFILSVAERGNYVIAHEMTTHPSLYEDGTPKKKYLLLTTNPNPDDSRNSFVNKKLRKISKKFNDTGNKRLTEKKKWKLSRKDKKRLNTIDRKKK